MNKRIKMLEQKTNKRKIFKIHSKLCASYCFTRILTREYIHIISRSYVKLEKGIKNEIAFPQNGELTLKELIILKPPAKYSLRSDNSIDAALFSCFPYIQNSW